MIANMIHVWHRGKHKNTISKSGRVIVNRSIFKEAPPPQI